MGCVKLELQKRAIVPMQVVYRKVILEQKSVQRFMSVDPLAEMYYSWSGYNYVLGNPILMIDPTGMNGEKADDWFKDTDGSIQYDPNVHSQADLKDGQTYIGTSHVGTGASGSLFILMKEEVFSLGVRQMLIIEFGTIPLS